MRSTKKKKPCSSWRIRSPVRKKRSPCWSTLVRIFLFVPYGEQQGERGERGERGENKGNGRKEGRGVNRGNRVGHHQRTLRAGFLQGGR